jgi:lysozyme family protein
MQPAFLGESIMTDLVLLAKRNAARWAAAKLTRGPEFIPVARRLVAGKARYEAVESRTGVPWYFVAVTHQRESSQDWNTQLGQGDPLDRVSTHVPKGRGPFFGPTAWEDAAVDALVNCAPYAARNKDWSVGGLLTMLERYNGLAYANAGVPSPYVWSGTDQYVRGKVLLDHGPIEPVVDKQLGCAGLLLAMKQIDPSINLGASVPAPVSPVAPKTAAAGAVVAAGAAGAAVAASSGASFTTIALIIASAIAAAIVAWFVLHHRKV